MSVTESLSSRIKYMPKGKPFAGMIFAHVGSRAAVDKALSRMVQNGLLERVSRGIYMRPKISEYSGKAVRANPISVMHTVAKARGETLQIHGAEAVRRLGLSTQTPVLPTYYTSGNSREIRIGNARVRLQHACKMRLQQAGSPVGVALTALLYLRKEGLTEQAIHTIASQLSTQELTELLACKMPQWLRIALADYTKGPYGTLLL